jgi:hypothetical protein
VEGVYSFADERRAGLIAKTESFRAANLANKDAWRLSGVVETVAWYTAEDQRVCQFCAVMDGVTIAVDDNFFDAGDTIKGIDGGTMKASYGDIDPPPMHPDCRCYLRPEEIRGTETEVDGLDPVFLFFVTVRHVLPDLKPATALAPNLSSDRQHISLVKCCGIAHI